MIRTRKALSVLFLVYGSVAFTTPPNPTPVPSNPQQQMPGQYNPFSDPRYQGHLMHQQAQDRKDREIARIEQELERANSSLNEARKKRDALKEGVRQAREEELERYAAQYQGTVGNPKALISFLTQSRGYDSLHSSLNRPDESDVELYKRYLLLKEQRAQLMIGAMKSAEGDREGQNLSLLDRFKRYLDPYLGKAFAQDKSAAKADDLIAAVTRFIPDSRTQPPRKPATDTQATGHKADTASDSPDASKKEEK